VRLSIPQADSITFRYFQHWRLAFSLLSVSKDTLFARRKHAALKGKVSSPYKTANKRGSIFSYLSVTVHKICQTARETEGGGFETPCRLGWKECFNGNVSGFIK
jgi:hypothetical protein